MFDLTEVKPHVFIRYGLGCLETLASQGDEYAKDIREKMRIVVICFLLINFIIPKIYYYRLV